MKLKYQFKSFKFYKTLEIEHFAEETQTFNFNPALLVIYQIRD